MICAKITYRTPNRRNYTSSLTDFEEKAKDFKHQRLSAVQKGASKKVLGHTNALISSERRGGEPGHKRNITGIIFLS